MVFLICVGYHMVQHRKYNLSSPTQNLKLHDFLLVFKKIVFRIRAIHILKLKNRVENSIFSVELMFSNRRNLFSVDKYGCKSFKNAFSKVKKKLTKWINCVPERAHGGLVSAKTKMRKTDWSYWSAILESHPGQQHTNAIHHGRPLDFYKRQVFRYRMTSFWWVIFLIIKLGKRATIDSNPFDISFEEWIGMFFTTHFICPMQLVIYELDCWNRI